MLESVTSWSAIIPIKAVLAGAVLSISVGFSGPLAAWTANSGTAANARAVTTQTAPLGPAERRNLLDEIETYLDGVDTLRAGFVQNNMDGSVYRGTVYLDRPGKMRIEYDPPVPYRIIADGRFYIFIDETLEEASYIPLGMTPADILLRQPLNLGADLIVTGVARVSGALFVTVARQESPEAGTLTLAFAEDPLTLRQWTVIDAQGVITRVILHDLETGIELDPKLFSFINPWTTRESGN